MDRIALAIDSDGRLADNLTMIEILIYERQKGWVVADHIRVTPGLDKKSALEVRQEAQRISKSLLEKDCNLIVGKEIVGILYHTFCKAGLEVFEAEEISNELFFAIYEDYLLEKEIKVEEIEMVLPRPIPADDEGNYYFDFVKAIKCHPELSSKKMLMPFLTNNLFFSLLIRCEHRMPWLDDFIENHGLKLEAKHENGIYNVLITHKSCNE